MKTAKIYSLEVQGRAIVSGRPVGRIMRELKRIQTETGCYLQSDYFSLCAQFRALPAGCECFVPFGASFCAIVTCNGERTFNA